MIEKSFQLSRQEERVLSLARQGLGDKQIAVQLGLSADTVRTYWQRIRQKIGAGTRAEIVATLSDQSTAVALQAVETEKDVLVQEILRRKTVEKALRTSEREWRQLADSMPQIVFVSRMDAFIFHYNARFFEYTGLDPESVSGMTWASTLHEADLPKVQAEVERSLPNALPFNCEGRIRRHDGEYRWHIIKAVPHFDENGKAYRYYGTATDIHETVKLRKELEDRQSRLEQAQQLANLGYFEFDAANNRAVFSPSLFRIFGLAPREGWFDASYFLELIHPDDQPSVVRAIERVFKEVQSSDETYRILTPSNELVYIHSVCRCNAEDDGTIWASGVMKDVTAATLSAQRMAVIQAALETAEEIAKIGNFSRDLRTNKSTWSKNMYALFERTPDDGVPTNPEFLAMLNDDHQKTYLEAMHRTMTYGDPLEIEYELHFEGLTKWIHAIARVEMEDGVAVKLEGTCQDMTVQKARESELLASEQRFRSITDVSPTGIFVTDVNGDCTYTNATYQSMTGFELEQTLGQGWVAAIHPDDRSFVFETWYQKAQIQEPFSEVFRYQKPDGSIRNVHVRAVEVFIDDKPAGYVGGVEDVTEMFRLQDSLSKSEEWQRAILNGTAYSIISTDASGLILTFNKGAEEMLEYTAEEMIGKQTPVLIHDWSEVEEQAALLGIVPGFDVFVHPSREGKPSELNWTYIAKSGRRFLVALSVTTLQSTEGEVHGYLGIARRL